MRRIIDLLRAFQCVAIRETMFLSKRNVSLILRAILSDIKTSCFGIESTALYDDRKAFYDTKTTCFGVVVASETF